MIHSLYKKLGRVFIPVFQGEIKMLPFNLSDLSTIPGRFRATINEMLSFIPTERRIGVAYLTIDGRTLDPGTTHRRGGAHIDGNFLPSISDWCTGSGGGNGWKVGENGRALNTQEHKISYENPLGGLIMVSDYASCKGWEGKFQGEPGIGGDCRHIKLNEGFILEPNVIYYGNSQFIHESLPVEETVHRTLIRITLPLDYPTQN